MTTRTDVSTASILVRGPLERVREVVVRLGREAWVAPAGEGWVLVLPDRPVDPAEAVDEVDPYDLVGFGRSICDGGLRQVLVFSVRRGLGVSQLMSRDHETAFIGWRSAESGEVTGVPGGAGRVHVLLEVRGARAHRAARAAARRPHRHRRGAARGVLPGAGPATGGHRRDGRPARRGAAAPPGGRAPPPARRRRAAARPRLLAAAVAPADLGPARLPRGPAGAGAGGLRGRLGVLGQLAAPPSRAGRGGRADLAGRRGGGRAATWDRPCTGGLCTGGRCTAAPASSLLG